MIQAILFDLDGTLLDRDASIEPFLIAQYERYKLHHLPFGEYRDRFIELDDHGYTDKMMVFQTLITEFAIPITVEELVADFRLNPGSIARLFLARLRSWSNCACGATNWGSSRMGR